jgi:hypothetical protein
MPDRGRQYARGDGAKRDASGLGLDVAPGPDADGHGLASAVAVVSGPGAEVFAQRWSGSIQWIAESPLRPLHKRKNWFIAVMCFRPRLARRRPSIRARCASKRSGRAAPAASTKTRLSPPCARCMCRAVLQPWRGTAQNQCQN